MSAAITGGCQCGAARYRCSGLGKASICHCRMCQKAFGNYFAPLVEVEALEWTRGTRALFHSSNLSSRGFCRDCGTPLTLETRGAFEVAVGSLDDPSRVEIAYNANIADRHEITMRLHEIPEATQERQLENDAWNARIESRQHPDHDTDRWPEEDVS
jgi:hypothetical protein